MSVEITFEHDGSAGLVAEGTYLWEAARRLGVPMVAECSGRGECDTCAVAITRGDEILSPPTAAERRQLGQERLNSGQRLACQANLVRSGELHLRPMNAKSDSKQS